MAIIEKMTEEQANNTASELRKKYFTESNLYKWKLLFFLAGTNSQISEIKPLLFKKFEEIFIPQRNDVVVCEKTHRRYQVVEREINYTEQEIKLFLL